jgi:voltage-gated potassium channel
VYEWIERRMRRAVVNRRVFPYLAATAAISTVGAALIVRLIDKKDFPTYGDSLWFSVQTLSTVGYGDVVPTSSWGRLVGGLVIVIGATFLAYLTATVTSYFVSAEQEQASKREHELRAESDEEMRALLERVETRLAAIESKLEALPASRAPQ